MNNLTEATDLSAIEKTLMQGDLSSLNEQQRLDYYRKVCETLKINPFTKPFEYIKLNGKLTLYARRDATDQLRKTNNVSVRIVERNNYEQLYVVTARAETANGRVDESIGAVNINGLKGESLANAFMKAETKAKRRVTLSICGLGFMDETEIESVGNTYYASKSASVEKTQNQRIEQMKRAFSAFGVTIKEIESFAGMSANEFSAETLDMLADVFKKIKSGEMELSVIKQIGVDNG